MPTDLQPRSAAQRKQDQRDRKAALGLKRVPDLWAHPSDHDAIKNFVCKLNLKREKA